MLFTIFIQEDNSDITIINKKRVFMGKRVSHKVQTAFRFDKDLLELVKEKAKAQRRSLNNYLEILMLKDVGNIPSDETKEAIEEARTGNLESIDNLDDWLEKL
jgi:hypothetical protein